MIEGTGAAQFSTIAAAAHGCGAIVGATALQIAAPSIAERLGIPYVFTAYCPAGVAAAMIAAARALGRRSIVSRGWAHLSLSDDEGDALAIAEVNQQALFTRVAAVVHHGGAGTTTAAQAGTPQVIVPQHYDQHYWARRVQDLGIGTAHVPGAPTADSLTRALENTITPRVAASAKEIASRMRRDGARSAAQRLAAAETARQTR